MSRATEGFSATMSCMDGRPGVYARVPPAAPWAPIGLWWWWTFPVPGVPFGPVTVVRPVWRTFLPRFLGNAAVHVRAGGLAVVRHPGAWSLLVPCDPEGAIPELAAWALLDVGVRGFDRVTEGPAEGLLEARLPRALQPTASDRCERDSTAPGSTVAMDLDCRACAWCCRSNRVVLEDEDIARWTDAGRDDLGSSRYVRRVRGGRRLRVLPGGDCVHLGGNDCGIYALRPDNCRAFPAGSEGCLGARAEAGLDVSPTGSPARS